MVVLFSPIRNREDCVPGNSASGQAVSTIRHRKHRAGGSGRTRYRCDRQSSPRTKCAETPRCSDGNNEVCATTGWRFVRESKPADLKNSGSAPKWLGNLDSNQDKQSQSLLCYRYTIPQRNALQFQAIAGLSGTVLRAGRQSRAAATGPSTRMSQVLASRWMTDFQRALAAAAPRAGRGLAPASRGPRLSQPVLAGAQQQDQAGAEPFRDLVHRTALARDRDDAGRAEPGRRGRGQRRDGAAVGDKKRRIIPPLP